MLFPEFPHCGVMCVWKLLASSPGSRSDSPCVLQLLSWAGRELGAGGRVFEEREFGFRASLFFSSSDKAVISIVWVKREQR